ncbi:hypothetical protein BGW80DRAFT_581769 [Lactifluus volemus]|nr:hypothetical protein BGW80DRAFT_581769 [Lactifluus volemus]
MVRRIVLFFHFRTNLLFYFPLASSPLCRPCSLAAAVVASQWGGRHPDAVVALSLSPPPLSRRCRRRSNTDSCPDATIVRHPCSPPCPHHCRLKACGWKHSCAPITCNLNPFYHPSTACKSPQARQGCPVGRARALQVKLCYLPVLSNTPLSSYQYPGPAPHYYYTYSSHSYGYSL